MQTLTGLPGFNLQIGNLLPHVNFTGYREYPDDQVSMLQLRVLDFLINQAEMFIKQKLSNALEVTKKGGELVGCIYLQSLEDNVSSLRSCVQLEQLLLKKLGIRDKNFLFLDLETGQRIGQY